MWPTRPGIAICAALEKKSATVAVASRGSSGLASPSSRPNVTSRGGRPPASASSSLSDRDASPRTTTSRRESRRTAAIASAPASTQKTQPTRTTAAAAKLSPRRRAWPRQMSFTSAAMAAEEPAATATAG